MTDSEQLDTSTIDAWLESRKKGIPLTHHGVLFDDYDREDYMKLREELVEFAAAGDTLGEYLETGSELFMDTFMSLFKYAPAQPSEQEVDPKYRINHRVDKELMSTKEWKINRAYGTVGDDVTAAFSAMSLRKKLNVILDKLKDEQKKAEELAQKYEETLQKQLESSELQENLEDLMNSDEVDEDEVENLKEKLEQLEQELNESKQETAQKESELNDSLDSKKTQIKVSLRKAMSEVNADQESVRELLTWGSDPGSPVLLSPKERMELAKTFNSDRFKRIFEVLGRMRLALNEEQRSKTDFIPQEVYDVTKSNDLSKMLPSQMYLLAEDCFEDLFYYNFLNKQLLTYKMRGNAPKNKGGIVILEDGSGSMRGEREIWAKAVGIALMELARKQKRTFKAIHFGSASEQREFNFDRPEDYTPHKMIEFAGFFFGGGTNFEVPLKMALKGFDKEFEEHGRVEGDIVFITDGESYISDSLMTLVREKQEKYGFKIYGVMIGGRRDGEPLYTLCDRKVVSVKNLLDSTIEIREIFGSI